MSSSENEPTKKGLTRELTCPECGNPTKPLFNLDRFCPSCDEEKTDPTGFRIIDIPDDFGVEFQDDTVPTRHVTATEVMLQQRLWVEYIRNYYENLPGLFKDSTGTMPWTEPSGSNKQCPVADCLLCKSENHKKES